MELIEFMVRGKHKDTSRYRNEHIKAISEDQCRREALEKGLLEPYVITIVPPMDPTKKQLEYAKNLKIEIPQGASISDVSVLIVRATSDRSTPSLELLEYANGREMVFNKYIGKKALYNLVFGKLKGKDKIAFFLFCVYRWLSDDRYGNLDKHQYKDKFYILAETLVNNESFIQSMNRYSGESIRYFGEFHTNGGIIHSGGSIDTIAYKTASKIICDEFGLKNRRTKTIHDASEDIENPNVIRIKVPETKPKLGCLLPVVSFFMVTILLLAFILR